MKKQFVNWNEARRHINAINDEILKDYTFSAMDMLLDPDKCSMPDPDRLIKTLKNEGYDMDNLMANGEYYRFLGHTNNGWKTKDDSRYIPTYDIVKMSKDYEPLSDDEYLTSMSIGEYICSVITDNPEALEKILKDGYKVVEYGIM